MPTAHLTLAWGNAPGPKLAGPVSFARAKLQPQRGSLKTRHVDSKTRGAVPLIFSEPTLNVEYEQPLQRAVINAMSDHEINRIECFRLLGRSLELRRS